MLCVISNEIRPLTNTVRICFNTASIERKRSTSTERAIVRSTTDTCCTRRRTRNAIVVATEAAIWAGNTVGKRGRRRHALGFIIGVLCKSSFAGTTDPGDISALSTPQCTNFTITSGRQEEPILALGASGTIRRSCPPRTARTLATRIALSIETVTSRRVTRNRRLQTPPTPRRSIITFCTISRTSLAFWAEESRATGLTRRSGETRGTRTCTCYGADTRTSTRRRTG